MKKKTDAQQTAHEELKGIFADLAREGGRINRNKEQTGFITVLDEAQEAHAAFRAVAELAECVPENRGLNSLKGSDLAALLRVVNARLGRAIDVAFAAAEGSGGGVVQLHEQA